MLRDAARGFTYLRSQRPLMLLLGLSIVVVSLGMPFRNLLPVFQKDVFGVGPTALGVMYTAVGIGTVAASLLAAAISDSLRTQQIQLASGVGFGLSLVLFALSPSYLLGLGLLSLVGFSSQVFLTLNKTLLMLASEREYYGRVMSIYMMGFSLNPIVLLPMGAAVDRVGAPATIAVAGAGVIAVIALTGAAQVARARSGSGPLLAGSRQ
jgi:predicted MFS family arabinose efflux permease